MCRFDYKDPWGENLYSYSVWHYSLGVGSKNASVKMDGRVMKRGAIDKETTVSIGSDGAFIILDFGY